MFHSRVQLGHDERRKPFRRWIRRVACPSFPAFKAIQKGSSRALQRQRCQPELQTYLSISTWCEHSSFILRAASLISVIFLSCSLSSCSLICVTCQSSKMSLSSHKILKGLCTAISVLSLRKAKAFFASIEFQK